MVTTLTKPKRRERKVPDYLIKEVIDGKPVYYKGYRSVLFGQKKLEDIMGASSLQAFLIFYLNALLIRNLEEDKYFIFTGEPGVHVERRHNFSGDLLVYEVSQITKIDKHYFDIPPVLQVEVDIDIDNSNFSNNEYLTAKTRSLLAFGVQKIVWVLSSTQTVIVAEPEQDWRIIDWNKDIELLPGIAMNIGAYLTKMNVVLE
ncbi:MAG: Uma2 family endonuclease [Spirosomataceae bacterium]